MRHASIHSHLSADAVREGASGGDRVGRLRRRNDLVVEKVEGQGGGVLGFYQGIAQQLTYFYRGYDWRDGFVACGGVGCGGQRISGRGVCVLRMLMLLCP